MNPKEHYESLRKNEISRNFGKLKEILLANGFEVAKDCIYKYVSNSQYVVGSATEQTKNSRTIYYRNKGLVIALEFNDAEKEEICWVSFIQRIVNIGDNYQKLKNMPLSGSFPSNEEELLYLKNQMHTSICHVPDFERVLKLCMSICDNEYNFDSEKHCLINSHTRSLTLEMVLHRDYFFTIGEILNLE